MRRFDATAKAAKRHHTKSPDRYDSPALKKSGFLPINHADNMAFLRHPDFSMNPSTLIGIVTSFLLLGVIEYAAIRFVWKRWFSLERDS